MSCPHTKSQRISAARCPQRFSAVQIGLAIVIATQLTASGSLAQESSTNAATRDQIYAPDHLLDVRIRVDPADWDQLRHQTRSLMAALSEENQFESPFDYVTADVTIDGQLIENVGIRKKGFLGSLDSHRPSLKIRFDKYHDQAPLGDLDRLTLNNNKQDPSRLSQYLSYRLFQRAGVKCSRCNFAKVSVNGKELGIYSNVEAIKSAMLKDAFGDGSGMLFEGTVADFVLGSCDRFESKTKGSNRDQLKQVATLLAADQIDLDKLDALVNVESFLHFWAVESLIGFWDGYTHNQNNFYLYRNPADSKFYFLPWGIDSAFTNFVPPVIDKITNRSFHSNASLANRLYRTRSTRQKYLAILQSLLDEQWDEAQISADIERVRMMLGEEVLDSKGFSKAVDGVQDFVRNRRQVIEEEFEQWPIPLRYGPRRPGYAKMLGEVTANFKTKWSKPLMFQRGFLGDADISLTVAGENVELRDMHASADFDSNKRGTNNVDSPRITLSAVRESDDTPLSFFLTFNPTDFQPSERSVPFSGLFMEGSLITFLAMMSRNPAAIKLIDGTAQLEQASTDNHDPVVGRAKFRIMAFAGGQKAEIAWEE